MSREVTYRTEIVVPEPQLASGALNIKERIKPDSPCFDLLRAAVGKAADARNGVVADEYADCTGQRHDCLLAVRTSDCPRGVGVNVEADGRVVFVYDTQTEAGDRSAAAPMRPEIAQAICDEIAQNYAAFAVRRAMQDSGFRTAHREEAQGSVIEGVKAA